MMQKVYMYLKEEGEGGFCESRSPTWGFEDMHAYDWDFGDAQYGGIKEESVLKIDAAHL